MQLPTWIEMFRRFTKHSCQGRLTPLHYGREINPHIWHGEAWFTLFGANMKAWSYSLGQSREWVDGSLVMGQMGRHKNRMGHMGHGSLGVEPWPISFFNSMAGLIYCGNENISCQSVIHVQLCMWLTKFQVHVHIQVHANRAARGYLGTRRVPG